jgi:glycosyltransferase involved in cell wall biosynthesis
MKPQNVKFSIIIVCKNSIKTINKSIDSVINQNFKNFELIVIDGDSTDGTKEFLLSKEKFISKFISEKDTGISNAFNKGISIANGEWLFFLNSDDYLKSNNTLNDVAEQLDIDMNLIIGRVQLINNKKKMIGEFGGDAINFNKMTYYNIIPHQATFIKKKLFKNNGYDESLSYSMDYEFYWKNKNNLKIKLINNKIAIVNNKGASAQNYLKLFYEYALIQRKYNVNSFFIIRINFLYRILKYYIKNHILS